MLSFGSGEDIVLQLFVDPKVTLQPKFGCRRSESGAVRTLEVSSCNHCQSCMVVLFSLSGEFLMSSFFEGTCWTRTSLNEQKKQLAVTEGISITLSIINVGLNISWLIENTGCRSLKLWSPIRKYYPILLGKRELVNVSGIINPRVWSYSSYPCNLHCYRSGSMSS